MCNSRFWQTLLAGALVPCLCGILPSTSFAQELFPTPKEFLIPQGTKTIDGDLADWDLAHNGYVIDPTQSGKDPAVRIFLGDPANPFRSPADLSARTALSWDSEFLYIAGSVTDDSLRGIRPGTPHRTGPAGWFCDSVMFRIHSFRQPLKTNTPYSKTPFLALRYEVPQNGRGRLIDNSRRILDREDSYWKLPEGSSLAGKETANGYQVEAAVPWNSLKFLPAPGEILFCAFMLADIDEGEKLNQLGWYFSELPNENAVFRLLGTPEATGLLSLSASRIEAGRAWSAAYRVDARTLPVTLTQFRIEGPEQRSIQVTANIPPGRSARAVLTVPEGVKTPGHYKVTLRGQVKRQPAILCQSDLEVVPPGEPPSRFSNPPGEIHHQRPDRVAHTAYEDSRRGVVRHGFVKDRSGYERYILTHVRDYVEKDMEPALKRGDRYITGKALYAYTLYKLTGEEKYADWTRRGIQLALANQKKKFDINKLYPLCDLRYHVWLQEPGTDLAPAGAEKDFQELWSRALTEHDPGWMFAEWGYHNRCYHRYFMLKIASHFAGNLGKQIPQKVRDYMAFHQKIHDHFGAATDNSSGYHWVGFRYPVYYCESLNDWSTLTRNKGWLDALSRWRRYSSPSGAVPNFGDTSGWGAGAGQAMAYYELMARLTRDGRFRWQAHRIAEYLFNHFWPRHDQYHGPRDFIATGFCHAWLFADDSVRPEPPRSSSTVTFRTRIINTPQQELLARPGLSRQRLTDEQVPDKLVLSSGNDPRRLWALVELLDLGGHCGRLPGNIITLIQHDAALLAGQGYYERSPDFNNILWIEDRDGIAADPRPMRTEVTRLADDPAVTYVRLRIRRYQQLPVTYVRDIVFVKNGFLLVKDRATFHATMRVRFGPCWQTRDIGPQCGPDWFNAYYEYIYFTGLGLGRGVHAYRNPAWDLLIKFGPRAGTRTSLLDRYKDNPYRASPVQMRQSWAGIVRQGESKSFTTILLPHPPALDVTPYGDSAEFIIDDDETTAVRARTELDNWNHLGESFVLLLQDKPKKIKAGNVESDAILALGIRDSRGRQKPAVIIDGNTFRIGGANYAASARHPAMKAVYELKD